MFVIAQKAQLNAVVWHSSECVCSRLRFCWLRSKPEILSGISWLFGNIPQTASSTKPESGISAEKSSKSYGFKPGELVLELFSFYQSEPQKRLNSPHLWLLPCPSQRASAGVDPHSAIVGGMLILLWQYNIKGRFIRFMLFLWAAVQ